MICALEISFPGNLRRFGTAWLAGPRVLVTAGHNVYDSVLGGWASAIRVSFGLGTGGGSPVSCDVRGMRSVRGWVENGIADCDYGMVPLDQPLGNVLGWFDSAAVPDEGLRNSDLHLAGCPADQGVLYHYRCRPEELEPGQLYFNLPTDRGESGSPIWLCPAPGSGRVVVGIHARLNGRASATRVTDEVARNIAAWAADPFAP